MIDQKPILEKINRAIFKGPRRAFFLSVPSGLFFLIMIMPFFFSPKKNISVVFEDILSSSFPLSLHSALQAVRFGKICIFKSGHYYPFDDIINTCRSSKLERSCQHSEDS